MNSANQHNYIMQNITLCSCTTKNQREFQKVRLIPCLNCSRWSFLC